MKKIYFSVLLILCFQLLKAFALEEPKRIAPTHGRAVQVTPLPQLGSLTDFTLFTTAGAVGNTGVSNITGNIGTNVGAITGFETSTINGTKFINDAVTTQGVADLNIAYNQIMATTNTAAHGAVYGNGETLYAGVYFIGAAASTAGTLTIDAQGDPNAVFIIKVGGAFSTGAGTTVVLTNGASAANIFWVADGAISMAALTTMKGTLIAHNGAISMGAGGSLEGRMFSTTGAVAVYGNTIYYPGSIGLNWIGTVSTDWNNPANWLTNSVPGTADKALIGVNQPFTYLPNILAASGQVNVGAITFGLGGGQAPGLVVNTGSTLNVAKGIIFQSDASATLGYACTLSGAGIINADSIAVIANTAISGQSYTVTMASSATNINIASNLTITSSTVGADISNAVFKLTGGTAQLNGTIKTTNAAGSTSAVMVLPAVGANLKLNNTTALSTLSATGTNVVSFNNPGATIEYSGVAQTIYNDATIAGLSGGVSYQNLTLSGSGLKTLAVGNLNISGNLTNGLANTVNDNLNLLNNTVNFSGTSQTLAGGPGGGTVFNKVTFSGAGIKTMASGRFFINSTGLLTMAGNNASTILNAGGLLTLISDTSGSASIAAINAGPSITGNVNVQRYFKAQTSGATADNTRNYRLLSSAVNNGSGNYALSYLNNNSGVYVSGPTGITGGFTTTNATPTIYLYNESLTANNTSFSGGNFKGITDISTDTLAYYTSSGTTTATTTLPVGNGFFLYYMGNNFNNVTSTTSLNKQFRYNGAYIAPDAATTTATGVLNQGAVTVKLWWNGGVTLSDAKTGYNLVGNPYASTIDWDQSSSSNNTAGIYAPQVSQTIYVFNYANRNYGAYLAGTAGGTGTNNASRYIASGQGFYIKATAATGSSLTFNEVAKTITAPNSYGPAFTLMSVNKAVINPVMRLKLAKDAINTDDILLLFEPDSKNGYEPDHDAVRLTGLGNVATLASFAKNSNVMLAINRYNNIDSNTRIKIYVNVANSTGTDTLSISGLNSLDNRYNIFLIDHYKKDSLLFSRYPQYPFNISNADTSSFGANRFELVFHKKPALNYKLLAFGAVLVKKGVLLTWQTSNESNLTTFSVERNDGTIQYASLNTLQSNGNGSYSYTDTSPLNGINNYRLMQNDAFNVTTYSKIASIDNTSSNQTQETLTVYPNPATSQFSVTINQNAPSIVTIRVINFLGQTVINRQSNGNNISQQINNLYPGNYLIKVIDYNTQKLIGIKKIIIK
jgi:hypothetical protein